MSACTKCGQPFGDVTSHICQLGAGPGVADVIKIYQDISVPEVMERYTMALAKKDAEINRLKMILDTWVGRRPEPHESAGVDKQLEAYGYKPGEVVARGRVFITAILDVIAYKGKCEKLEAKVAELEEVANNCCNLATAGLVEAEKQLILLRDTAHKYMSVHPCIENEPCVDAKALQERLDHLEEDDHE
jgi:hypothetical protein